MNHEHPPTRFVPQPTRKRYKRYLWRMKTDDKICIINALDTLKEEETLY